jgi:MFS family permease
VLRHSDFSAYFIGSTVSNLGTWLANTTQAILAYNLTHSAFTVGLIVCFQFTPVLMVGPLAGGLVARTGNLRSLLVATQLVSAIVAGGLAVLDASGHLGVAGLAVGALVMGTAYCFALPAFSILVPALVPPGESRAALAMNSVSYNIGRTAAPALAVLIITWRGFAPAFALNAVSFLALAAVLAKTQLRNAIPRQEGRPRITDGFRAAKRNRIWLLLLMVAAVTITADPILVLGPTLAHQLHLPTGWAGFFLSALGAGTIFGSLLPVPSPERLRSAAYPLALLGLSVLIFSLGWDRWVCLGAAVLAGIACLLTGAVTQTLLLEFSGPNRAVVMAVWAIAWAGTKPLASLIDGLLATVFNVHIAGAVLALPALLPALFLMAVGREGQRIIPPEWKTHLFSTPM